MRSESVLSHAEKFAATALSKLWVTCTPSRCRQERLLAASLDNTCFGKYSAFQRTHCPTTVVLCSMHQASSAAAMDSLGLLRTASSGMDAQRAVLDIEARNVAAAEAAGPKGSYARLVPDFQLVQDENGTPEVTVTGSHLQRNSGVDTITEMVAVLNA